MRPRPDSRSVEHYRALLVAGNGSVDLEQKRKYSLRTRIAAIYRWRHKGKNMPLQDLPDSTGTLAP